MQIKIDTIVFSKRKTYSLQINEDLKLILKVPINTDDAKIKDIITKHRNWILKKLSLKKLTLEKVKHYKFEDGEKFLLLGNYHKLKFVNDRVEPVIVNKEIRIPEIYYHSAKETLIKLYKIFAYKIFLERMEYFSNLLNLRFTRLKISNARKRWGSCSSSGNINLSWRLVMAPPDIIDYVIVHELIHLKIKNHSKDFWKMVQTVDPDFRKKMKWLKDNEPLLRI